MTVFIEGSLDTLTSPDLENELKGRLDDVSELILDFAQVSFISSAGIRVVLWARKQMQDRGKLVLKNVDENVQEVFKLTGLTTILNFE